MKINLTIFSITNFQGGREHLTVNHTGIQIFINMLFYSLAQIIWLYLLNYDLLAATPLEHQT